MRLNHKLTTATWFITLLIVAMQLSAQQQQRQSRLQLAGIFGDHMVLQQQTDAAIWGVAKPKSKVSVATSWDGKVSKTKADADGKWTTTVNTPGAGGPFEIQIKSGQETKTLKNVMSGEVWICSGQSNMQWKMRGFGVDHFKADVDKANHPNIRLCQVPQILSLEPQDDIKCRWGVCTPKSALQFSATAYFFANKLREEIDAPIGLVSTNWGGSSAEAWVNEDVLKKQFPAFDDQYAGFKEFASKTGLVYSRGKNKPPKGLNHRSPSVPVSYTHLTLPTIYSV